MRTRAVRRSPRRFTVPAAARRFAPNAAGGAYPPARVAARA